MINPDDCLRKYGDPVKEHNMVLWDVPSELELGVIPKRLYCNRDIIPHLSHAFHNVISRNILDQLRTFDGCFNNRMQRGASQVRSIHAWGLAIDINANWNRLGQKPTMSRELVTCFTDAGFDWGGKWSRPDGMHFQLAALPVK
jgi:hypothetical protein